MKHCIISHQYITWYHQSSVCNNIPSGVGMQCTISHQYITYQQSSVCNNIQSGVGMQCTISHPYVTYSQSSVCHIVPSVISIWHCTISHQYTTLCHQWFVLLKCTVSPLYVQCFDQSFLAPVNHEWSVWHCTARICDIAIHVWYSRVVEPDFSYCMWAAFVSVCFKLSVLLMYFMITRKFTRRVSKRRCVLFAVVWCEPGVIIRRVLFAAGWHEPGVVCYHV